MLAAEDRPIRVVEEGDQIVTPDENDLRLGDEQRDDGAPESLRPRLWRSERRRGPVEGTHSSGHLAVTRKEPSQLARLWRLRSHRFARAPPCRAPPPGMTEAPFAGRWCASRTSERMYSLTVVKPRRSHSLMMNARIERGREMLRVVMLLLIRSSFVTGLL